MINIAKKVIYCTYLSICFIVWALHMFGPFGGITVYYMMANNGFYDDSYIMEKFGVSITPLLHFVNQIVGVLFMTSITLPLVLFFIKPLSFHRKFTIAICCLLVLAAIAFVPKIYALV